MDISILEQKVKEMNSEKRYRHSLGVRDEAVKLAKVYGADVEKARIAGLVHDCVKDIDYDRMMELCKELDVNIDEISRAEKKLMHSRLGAHYAKKVLGIDDDEIFDAVYYHTTGKANMPLLTKIIYIADFIEPNRSYQGVVYLRKLSYLDIDAAILERLNYTINKMLINGKMLHADTVMARNYILLERGKEE